MKTEVLYVFLFQDGRCQVVRDQRVEQISLTDLLADGWRPVRETPVESRALILLERDSDENFGFGFNKS